MSKFHVGDRVRVQDPDSEDNHDGQVGVVTKVDPEPFRDNIPYKVEFEDDDYDWYPEEYLRPADIFAQVDEDLDDIAVIDWQPESSAIQEAVDVVNHPPHYNRFPVEVINITEQLDFNRGNAVKYLARAGFKEGVDELEDLSKAAWYVNRAIEKLKKERETND